MSKTFTATLAGYTPGPGQDAPRPRQPALAGTAGQPLRRHQPARPRDLYRRRLLPLQFPDSVQKDQAQIRDYHRQWQPTYAPGVAPLFQPEHRPVLAISPARSRPAVRTTHGAASVPGTGPRTDHLDVPEAALAQYAQGYGKDDRPLRVGPGRWMPKATG